jgi:hypothetical protein
MTAAFEERLTSDEIRTVSLPLIEALRSDDDAMGTSNAVVLMNLIAGITTERDRYHAAIQAVRSEHYEDDGWCHHCCFSWPCITVRLLDRAAIATEMERE